jgi:hypothetical protein
MQTGTTEVQKKSGFVEGYEFKDERCPVAFAAYVGDRPLSSFARRLAIKRGLIAGDTEPA